MEEKLTKRAARNLAIRALYQYRPFAKPEHGDHLAALLKDGRVRYSNPANFNDPWECRPYFSPRHLATPEARERAIQWMLKADIAVRTRGNQPLLSKAEQDARAEALRSNPTFLQSLVDQMTDEMAPGLRAEYRIFCLTTKPDNPLMWSHYADHHRGICVGFGTKGEFGHAYKVDYSIAYPELDFADEDDYAFVIASLLTKAKVWEYEDEYRSVNREGGMKDHPNCKDGFVNIAPDDVQAVIMGFQMADKERAVVEAIVDKAGRHVELLRARLVPGRFELTLEKA